MAIVNRLVSDLVGGVVTSSQGCREVATFNGVSQVIECPRVTGIDLGSLDCELEGYFDLTGTGTLFAQNISSSNGLKEFQIYTSAIDTITFILGGDQNAITLGASVKQDTALWGFRFLASQVTIYKNGVELVTDTVSIGADREPTATFTINGRHDDGQSTYGFFLGGESRDHKVWIGGDRNTGTLVRDYPVDDGWVSNPTIRELANNQDGTAISFTEAAWSERCDL